MENSLYFAETLKSITVSLLRVFSKVMVARYNKDRSVVVKSWPVPIAAAPIDKPQSDRTENYSAEDPDAKRYYQTIPRMALNFLGMTYDPDRAVSSNDFRYFFDPSVAASELNGVFKDYQPSPFNFLYSLSIKTNYINDFSQIIEGILPYFNPKLYIRVKEFSFLNIERDLPVVLNDFQPNFSDDLNIEEKRQVDSVITFTVEGFVYRPISRDKLVKVIKTRFWTGDETNYQGDIAVDMYSKPAENSSAYDSSAYDANSSAYYYANNISDSHS